MARRKGLLIVGLCALSYGALGLSAQKRLDVQSVGVIKLKGSHGMGMEDISMDGRVLVLNPVERGSELLLWDPAKATFARRIVPDWGRVPALGRTYIFSGEASPGLPGGHMEVGSWVPAADDGPRSFKLVDPHGDMVGAFGYLLAIVDGKKGTLRTTLCAPDLKDTSSPYKRTASVPYLHGVAIARYRYSGLVAAAFNFGKWPRLFLLRPPWKSPYTSWRMDRFVKALAWSPDGRTLAVLYSNVYNNHLKFVMPMRRGQPWPTLPDVALIDAETGKVRLKFFSGDMETSIVFSPDGKFIYCAGYNQGTMREWVVREFSASDGKIVRKFKKRGLRLKGNLAVSPDGRYLVADANSTKFSLGVIFNDTYGYDRRFRFVILDTATGKVVFKHQQKAENTLLTSPPTFAFSPDGKYLYVDPHLHELGSPEIQVYSLTESH